MLRLFVVSVKPRMLATQALAGAAASTARPGPPGRRPLTVGKWVAGEEPIEVPRLRSLTAPNAARVSLEMATFGLRHMPDVKRHIYGPRTQQSTACNDCRIAGYNHATVAPVVLQHAVRDAGMVMQGPNEMAPVTICIDCRAMTDPAANRELRSHRGSHPHIVSQFIHHRSFLSWLKSAIQQYENGLRLVEQRHSHSNKEC